MIAYLLLISKAAAGFLALSSRVRGVGSQLVNLLQYGCQQRQTVKDTMVKVWGAVGIKLTVNVKVT